MAEVLFVDDDADLTTLMAHSLSKAGHHVATCASGLEALSRLGIEPNDASAKSPDLLVLDIMMPKADGYVVATLIRNTPHTRNIPILVVSALHEMSRSFTATVRVDGFLPKPFSLEDLIGNVARILDQGKARA
ncbi:MAG: response regulator [Elusimicrobia bacterium]|nr:response regulator [Elusimicrobiota bacterium]